MKLASLELCKELYALTGWKETDYIYYANAGEHSGTVGHKSEFFDKPENLPAYELGYLVDKALETGHIHVKIKHGEKGVIITAPPCYHIEAQTPADGVAKLLIRSAKKGVI